MELPPSANLGVVWPLTFPTIVPIGASEPECDAVPLPGAYITLAFQHGPNEIGEFDAPSQSMMIQLFTATDTVLKG
jgi:hypothetical protein